MQRTNVISGLILCVIGLITLWVVIPMGIEQGPEGVMSPRLVPNLMMVLVVGLSVLLVVQNWHAARTLKNQAPVMARLELISLAKHGVVFAVALLLFHWGSSLGAGLTIILGSLLAFGERRLWMLLLMPTSILFLTWLVFYRVLQTPIV